MRGIFFFLQHILHFSILFADHVQKCVLNVPRTLYPTSIFGFSLLHFIKKKKKNRSPNGEMLAITFTVNGIALLLLTLYKKTTNILMRVYKPTLR